MARMLPERLPAGTPRSERAVFEALRHLPDPWVVIHGVAWQWDRNGRPGDGEADLVLLHPDRGLLVIEVKGGPVRIEEGRWLVETADGPRHLDPVEQAVSSKKALVGYLRDTVGGLSWIEAGHGIWLTDVNVDVDLGPALPRPIVADRSDLRDPTSAVERMADHWELQRPIDPRHLEQIVAKLAPTVRVEHRLADGIAEVKARLFDLTEGQQRALAGLRRSRRVIVYGSAGTGKTVLAIERARQLADDGLQVLLTCFNRPLGDAFAERFAAVPTVTAGSFHRLARRWIVDAGLPFPEDATRDWWEDAVAEALLDAAEVNHITFDAVIVDEGQDFNPSWFVALEAMLPGSDGRFLVFADPHQAIYREGWESPFEAVPYDLDLNVRNTRQIAEVVSRVFDDPVPKDGIDGSPVVFIPAADPVEVDEAVRRTVRELVHEGGLHRASIVVLTDRTEIRDRLIGTHAGDVALEGIDRPQGGVAVETIHRFKGLEADAAVVVLSRLETERDHALAYVGMSRARAHLTIVAPSEIGAALGFDAAP